jgi:2'-5' RNA ligase
MPASSSTERFRLFVAIRIPDRVKAEIEKAQNELRRGSPAGAVRWATGDQLHLTLRFLGGVEAPRVEELKAALARACGPFAALRLRAGGIDAFPSLRSPRVLWAGVRDADQALQTLQHAVAEAVGPFTREKAEKTYVGHVTIGRVKAISKPDARVLAARASSLADRVLGEWTAGEVELIRSKLTPLGACYTPIAAGRLTGGS